MSERVPGSYLLLFELGEEATIRVGKLGTFSFPAGWYVYVGSALGGIEQRVARHLRPSPVRRWHLDYLRAVAPIREVRLFPGAGRRECGLAGAVLALPGAGIPAPRFGASDCRCPAHLAHFPSRPRLDEVQ
ncbi:MAG: GIY-YIG nuclease family protein [Chloroflexi bacterium]|nr:GIY-YIG nuclease family protein [Chloroflexota bacterium]